MSEWSTQPPEFWEHLDTQVLGSTVSSVTFSGIDTDYRMFRLSCLLITATAVGTVGFRLNNDSAVNYDHQSIDASATTTENASRNANNQHQTTGSIAIGTTVSIDAIIMKQLATLKGRIRTLSSHDVSALSTTAISLTQGQWDNTADLISRIDLIANTAQVTTGSRLVLEGGIP